MAQSLEQTCKARVNCTDCARIRARCVQIPRTCTHGALHGRCTSTCHVRATCRKRARTVQTRIAHIAWTLHAYVSRPCNVPQASLRRLDCPGEPSHTLHGRCTRTCHVHATCHKRAWRTERNVLHGPCTCACKVSAIYTRFTCLLEGLCHRSKAMFKSCLFTPGLLTVKESSLDAKV